VALVDGIADPVSIMAKNTFNDLTITSTIGKAVLFPADTVTTINWNLIVIGTPTDIVTLGSSSTDTIAKIIVGGSESLTDAVYDGVMTSPIPPANNAQQIPTLGNLKFVLLSLYLFLLGTRYRASKTDMEL
jgi:hypothetical protein